MVALGYRQKPGVDYKEIHTPVMNEVTFRIMLVVRIVRHWKMKKIDVVASFMNGKINETTYLELAKTFYNFLKLCKTP